MLKPGGDPDLAREPLARHHAGEIRAEDLYGYPVAMAPVPREIHRGHATVTDLSFDLIAVVDDSGQRHMQGPAREGGGSPNLLHISHIRDVVRRGRSAPT